MSQDLVSSIPGIWAAMVSTITTAGNAQSPVVPVFPFAVSQYEPGTYVCIHDIENISLQPEDTSYSHIEEYDIVGFVSVGTGSGLSGTDTAGITLANLQAVYNTFQAVVMTPMVSNRTMPILGTSGPSPYQMFPMGHQEYVAGPGLTSDGKPWGWVGTLTFRFHFAAYLAVS